MKKSDFILIGVVAVIIAIALFTSKGNIVEPEIEYPLTLSGEVGLNEITYKEYESLVLSGEAFIVVIERTGCTYCQEYMPVVEEVANEKQIPITYINTDNLTTEEASDLNNNNKYLKKNQWGTPTTLFMLGDRVVDVISGYTDKDSVLEFLKDRVVMGD